MLFTSAKSLTQKCRALAAILYLITRLETRCPRSKKKYPRFHYSSTLAYRSESSLLPPTLEFVMKWFGRTDGRKEAGVILAYSVAKSCKRDGAFPILASSKTDQLPVDDQGPPFFDPRDARAVR
ncbi:hypothetical protein EDB85DRAFT_500132 [Lactarius pseudohatsudake]|nr:hypothetical protein EDB85DRAFT_500132 [Lactarius pseudohatsudake]